MGTRLSTALYLVLLVATIAGVDFLFFKNHFWERLMVKYRNRPRILSLLFQIPPMIQAVGAAARRMPLGKPGT